MIISCTTQSRIRIEIFCIYPATTYSIRGAQSIKIKQKNKGQNPDPIEHCFPSGSAQKVGIRHTDIKYIYNLLMQWRTERVRKGLYFHQ